MTGKAALDSGRKPAGAVATTAGHRGRLIRSHDDFTPWRELSQARSRGAGRTSVELAPRAAGRDLRCVCRTAGVRRAPAAVAEQLSAASAEVAGRPDRDTRMRPTGKVARVMDNHRSAVEGSN